MVSLLLFIIIALLGSWAYTPKRNYRNIESSDIDKTIGGLVENEIQSFQSDDIAVSIKRKNNRIVIEPYLPRVKEAFIRTLAFCLSIFLISSLLGIIASALNVFNVGDIEYDDYKAKDVNWNNVATYFARKFWYVYMVIAVLFGKQIRLKFINRIIQRSKQEQWEAFNQAYSDFEYKTKND